MPEPRDPKPASEHSARVNAAVGATLGFDDEGDWERATRGLVATHPTGAFDGPLGTAWDVAEYDPRHLQRRLRHRRALTLDGDGLSRRGEGRSGPTALAMGLVHELHPVTELKAKAIELAEELAAQPPIAVAGVLRAVVGAGSAPLDEALAAEREAVRRCSGSADQVEGMMAFLEKRPPRFEGR